MIDRIVIGKDCGDLHLLLVVGDKVIKVYNKEGFNVLIGPLGGYVNEVLLDMPIEEFLQSFKEVLEES